MATQRKGSDLERLTQPGGKPIADDASIPVLTERLTLPSLDLDISLPHPPPPVVAGPATPLPAAGLPRAPAPPPVDWTAVESALRDKLLAELEPRITAEFDRHLRERMQPALERALGLLSAELRNGVEALVRDTVAQVLAAEIARLKGGK